MNTTITLMGSFERSATDKEGESKITFLVPLSHLVRVHEVNTLTQRPLKITVEEA